MKRNIFIAALFLLATTGLQAQVLVKRNGEEIKFDDNKVVKMLFNVYDRESNGDDIHFVREQGDTFAFDIDDIQSLTFATEFSKIVQVEESGVATILYDMATSTVHVVNVESGEGIIILFDAEGKLVKRVKGNVLSVADLNAGLYIVSYNNVLNAKIVKK